MYIFLWAGVYTCMCLGKKKKNEYPIQPKTYLLHPKAQQGPAAGGPTPPPSSAHGTSPQPVDGGPAPRRAACAGASACGSGRRAQDRMAQPAIPVCVAVRVRGTGAASGAPVGFWRPGRLGHQPTTAPRAHLCPSPTMTPFVLTPRNWRYNTNIHSFHSITVELACLAKLIFSVLSIYETECDLVQLIIPTTFIWGTLIICSVFYTV